MCGEFHHLCGRYGKCRGAAFSLEDEREDAGLGEASSRGSRVGFWVSLASGPLAPT